MKSIRYAIYVSMVLHFLRKILHKEHAAKPVPCHNDLMKPGDPQGEHLKNLLLEGLQHEVQDEIDRQILTEMRHVQKLEDSNIRIYRDTHAEEAGQEVIRIDFAIRPKVAARYVEFALNDIRTE